MERRSCVALANAGSSSALAAETSHPRGAGRPSDARDAPAVAVDFCQRDEILQHVLADAPATPIGVAETTPKNSAHGAPLRRSDPI